MTKTISKKVLIGLNLLAILSILTPNQASAIARMDDDPVEKRTATANSVNFCTVFNSNQARLMENLANRESKLLEFRSARTEKANQRRFKQDATLKNIRSEGDQRRNELISKLNTNSTTSEQKNAISTYKKTIQDATTKRRAAVDSAIVTFRTGVTAATKEHKTAIDNAVTALKTATKSASEKAKTDCASGKDPKIVRQEFFSSMESARKAFKSAKDNAPTLNSQIETLTKTRKESVQSAFDEFRAVAEKARQDLRTALNE